MTISSIPTTLPPPRTVPEQGHVTAGLDPGTLSVSTTAAVVYGALHGLPKEVAGAAIRRRLHLHTGEVAELTRVGSRIQPARRYRCGEVAFTVSEDNKTVIGLEVDDDTALAAGFGLRLEPDLVYIHHDIVASFAEHEMLPLSEAEEEIRILLDGAARGPVAPVVPSGKGQGRHYCVGDTVIVTTPAHYAVKTIFGLQQQDDREWCDQNPTPLDVDTVAATNRALQRYAELRGEEVDLVNRRERRRLLDELRDHLEEHDGRLAPTRVSRSLHAEVRDYLGDGLVLTLRSSNRVIASVHRAPVLDPANLTISPAAVRDLTRYLPLPAVAAEVELLEALRDRAGRCADRLTVRDEERLAHVFEITIDGVRLDVHLRPDLERVERVALAHEPVAEQPGTTVTA